VYIRISSLPDHLIRRLTAVFALPALALCCIALLAGCGRFRRQHHETVYVSVRETYLHDRVAPVSNRVCEVTNGEALEVVEHGRRFLKVKTDQNQVGWIEERAVIEEKTYDGFVELAQQHRDDSAAVKATLRDDLAMHILPGRDTERFYLIAGNSKVDLLARASAPKKLTVAPAPQPAAKGPAEGNTRNSKSAAAAKPAAPVQPAAGGDAAEPPEMEDWWLARDAQGRVGWLLASRLEMDVPDDIAQYAEELRIVGAWVLTKVNDPAASTPDHQVPEYLTLLSPLKSGLPFDYDDVRVFTWSTRHHRYETAFRLHPVQGFLPVHVYSTKAAGANVPAFSILIAANGDIRTDPASGIARPSSERTISYDMIDTRVQRIGPDLAPLPVMHEPVEKKAAKTGSKTRNR